MAISALHHIEYLVDVWCWDILVEQIGYRVDKDFAGLSPFQGRVQFFRVEGKVKAV